MRFLASATAIMAALGAGVAALPAKQDASSAAKSLAAEGTDSAPSQVKQGTPFRLPPLPTGLAPGVYSFNHDAFGRPNHTRIGDMDTRPHRQHHNVKAGDSLEKRANTWTGCEGYSLTPYEQSDLSDAWNGLFNWAAGAGDGYSPWVSGHYYALANSGSFAYLCEWGSGNHAGTNEVLTAEAVVNQNCVGKAGIYQWNEWKKGIGAAAVGQTWCNGVNFG